MRVPWRRDSTELNSSALNFTCHSSYFICLIFVQLDARYDISYNYYILYLNYKLCRVIIGIVLSSQGVLMFIYYTLLYMFNEAIINVSGLLTWLSHFINNRGIY